MKKIIEHLKFEKTQRLVYGIGIILWVSVWFDSFQFIGEKDFLIFDFLQIIIPLFLLIMQLIFNNKFIWYILVTYAILYSLWIIWNLIELDILIEIQRDYLPRPFWTFERIQNWLITAAILLAANWTIWKIKPIEIKSTLHNNV